MVYQKALQGLGAVNWDACGGGDGDVYSGGDWGPIGTVWISTITRPWRDAYGGGIMRGK